MLNILCVAALLLLYSCTPQDAPQKPRPSFDLTTTADSLTLFGAGILSTPLYERDLAIHPDGNELIYTLGDYRQRRRCLVVLRKAAKGWGEAAVLPISGTYQDIEPFYANGGDRLYFASNRPIYGDSSRSDYNIWYSDRTAEGWAEPVALDSAINTKGEEFFPSVSEQGSLYFTATRLDGIGREDIFKAAFVNGQFEAPQALPATINTTAYEFNAYVSPQEDYLIFSSFGRKDGLGGGDLYLSRKDSTGQWTTAINMGAVVNSDKLDYCPFVDWEHRNFYFTSERVMEQKDPLSSVEALKALADDPQNGFGNLYRIGLDQLEYVE